MAIFVGSANEVIPRQIQRLFERSEFRRIFVYELLRRFSDRLRAPNDFHSMLIDAGQKTDLLAALAVITSQNIGVERIQNRPEVWGGVNVRNRSCDIKLIHGVIAN